jgi:hypothetical protein
MFTIQNILPVSKYLAAGRRRVSRWCQNECSSKGVIARNAGAYIEVNWLVELSWEFNKLFVRQYKFEHWLQCNGIKKMSSSEVFLRQDELFDRAELAIA